MNNKHLGILTIITVIVIIVAVVLTQKQEKPMVVSSQQSVFPKLMSTINDVDEIVIKTATESFILRRDQERWGLKEKYHYPVALDKVRKVLLGVAELTLLEAKTVNPELYSKLGVEDVSAKDAKSVLLTFNTKGQPVATLLIGRDQVAKIDSTRREIYIRKPDETQSWSAFGLLPLEKKATDWLDKEIINVEGQRVQQVSISHTDGQSVVFSKQQPKEGEYVLAEMPEHATLISPPLLKQIANALSFLNLEDVVPTTEIEFPENRVTKAIFATFDGLEVTATLLNQESKYYARFSARFVPEKVVKTEEQGTQPDVEQEVNTLNTRFSSWVFVLPDYKAGLLMKKREELIKIEPPASEMGQATTTSNTPPLEAPLHYHGHDDHPH